MKNILQRDLLEFQREKQDHKEYGHNHHNGKKQFEVVAQTLNNIIESIFIHFSIEKLILDQFFRNADGGLVIQDNDITRDNERQHRHGLDEL